uniref:Large ribosomal subunit protein uL3c n=1 Tax=Platysiphonia delicata TaxID=2006979 RepID=A0A1Z1M0K0_9FLOR|nr:ribosomal protein L3 [Platysiphonia delicata]ARW59627.1 ribosomal protein L3 [Platysiphonia delicata]
MPIGMLGRKVGMTQIFNSKGNAIPVTVLQIGPCTITNSDLAINSQIQIGYEYINPKKITASRLGYFKKRKIPCFKYLKSCKISVNESTNIDIGEVLTTKNFSIGALINVSGISIGKGFSGYQKRHHFSRGPMSHGSKNHKQPGSIGAGTTPGRVFPGKRMAGKMGTNRVTIKNLKIIDINNEENLIIIKGSVPGKNGNLLYVYNK